MNQTDRNWLGYKREDLIGKAYIDHLLAYSFQGSFTGIFNRWKESGGIPGQSLIGP
jgi:hypothetical protein